MKWIVENKAPCGTVSIWWNEKANEWTVNRMKATEFTTYQEANLVIDSEGGYLRECTTIEKQKSESNMKSG